LASSPPEALLPMKKTAKWWKRAVSFGLWFGLTAPVVGAAVYLDVHGLLGDVRALFALALFGNTALYLGRVAAQDAADAVVARAVRAHLQEWAPPLLCAAGGTSTSTAAPSLPAP